MTNKLKTAIKRKHREFGKYIKRGKKQEDWDLVKEVRNATCKMVASAREKYLMNLGWKLADRDQGPKTYWTVLNRLINKKEVINIPPLLENGVFVTSIQTKPQFSMISSCNSAQPYQLAVQFQLSLHDVITLYVISWLTE